jgi:hypothetical protein
VNSSSDKSASKGESDLQKNRNEQCRCRCKIVVRECTDNFYTCMRHRRIDRGTIQWLVQAQLQQPVGSAPWRIVFANKLSLGWEEEDSCQTFDFAYLIGLE